MPIPLLLMPRLILMLPNQNRILTTQPHPIQLRPRKYNRY
jgi:hypothetical protein